MRSEQQDIWLTVVVPTYNVGKLASDFIDHVSSWHSEGIEVVVMDGGSDDGTQARFQEATSSIPWMRVVSEKDQGIYDAMNKGIGCAQGEWLYFMGCDDRLMAPDILTKVKSVLQDHDMVYGNVLMDGKIYDGEFSTQRLLEKNICHQAIFYRKDLLNQLGQFSLRYKLLSDYHMNVLVFTEPNVRIKYVPLTIAVYATEGLSSSSVEEEFILELPRLAKRRSPERLNLVPAYQYISKLGLEHVYQGRRWKGLRLIMKGVWRGVGTRYLRFALAHILGRTRSEKEVQ